ncbi:MAG: hypothetical protein WKF86_05325 [Acidimicrobiales bacterium]
MLRTIDSLPRPWEAFGVNDIGGTQEGRFYRPVWVLWNFLLGSLPGDSAVVFHIANVLLLAASVVLVYALARRIGMTPGRSWVAAAVFAVYPRHAESVAWIAGSTDMTSTVLVLGTLVLLLHHDARVLPLAAAVVLAVTAALAKEAAFALPFLAMLLAGVSSAGSLRVRRRRVVTALAITVGLAGVFLLRLSVLGEIGGYAQEGFGPRRLVLVLASQLVAAFTPASLLVLQHPALLFVPLVLSGSLFGGLLYLVARRHETTVAPRLRHALIGAGLTLCALGPIANSAIDLNTANGERLLFLPSVGLAIMVGAVVPGLSRHRSVPLAGLALAVGVGLSLFASAQYAMAGRLTDRVVASAVRLAPPNSELVMLTYPDTYRSARLLGAGLQEAVWRAGRTDVLVATCLPTVVMRKRPVALSIVDSGSGRYDVVTAPQLPFDFPVGGGAVTSPGCTYQPSTGHRLAPGLSTFGVAATTPRRAQQIVVLFDGVDLRVHNESGSGAETP